MAPPYGFICFEGAWGRSHTKHALYFSWKGGICSLVILLVALLLHQTIKLVIQFFLKKRSKTNCLSFGKCQVNLTRDGSFHFLAERMKRSLILESKQHKSVQPIRHYDLMIGKLTTIMLCFPTIRSLHYRTHLVISRQASQSRDNIIDW